MFVVGSTKGATGNPALVQFDNTTTSERIVLRRSGGTNRLISLIQVGGATQAQPTVTSPSYVEGATGKSTLAFAANSVNVGFAGNLGTLNTNALIPSVTQAVIGNGLGSAYSNGTIQLLTYWPQRLPDSILQTLTK